MSKYRLPFDNWRCLSAQCDRRSRCLRFLADNTGAVDGQLSFCEPEPQSCSSFIDVEPSEVRS